jgi:hypothetical protein
LIAAFGEVPWVHVSELAAALIEQCVSQGAIAKETLWAKDLQEIGSGLLEPGDYVPSED